jgi:hypothetical protein
MSLSEIPPQGYRVDIPLPPRPADLVSESYSEAVHAGLAPPRMPPSATHLGQYEWAWSPMNNAIAELHLSLNRDRTHWIVWLGLFNDNDIPWHWDRTPRLVARHGKESREAAMVHLLEDGLAALRDDWNYDRFHWINKGGAMGVYRIEAIGDLVWGAQE